MEINEKFEYVKLRERLSSERKTFILEFHEMDMEDDEKKVLLESCLLQHISEISLLTYPKSYFEEIRITAFKEHMKYFDAVFPKDIQKHIWDIKSKNTITNMLSEYEGYRSMSKSFIESIDDEDIEGVVCACCGIHEKCNPLEGNVVTSGSDFEGCVETEHMDIYVCGKCLDCDDIHINSKDFSFWQNIYVGTEAPIKLDVFNTNYFSENT